MPTPCSMWDLSFSIGDQTHASGTGRPRLNHRAAGAVLAAFLKVYICLRWLWVETGLENWACAPWALPVPPQTSQQAFADLVWRNCAEFYLLSVLSRFSQVCLYVTPWAPARLLCPWDSPGKDTGVGCHAFCQGIFPTRGWNLHLLCLLPCRWVLYPLSHLGSPLSTRYHC